ncbi:MAG: hypothetical protein ACKVU1_13935 [bacterium]
MNFMRNTEAFLQKPLHQRRWAALAILAALFAAPGCGDDDDDPIGPGDPARIEGRVDGAGGYAKSAAPNAIEGAVVMVARVQANGSLQTIAVDSVLTDAQGRFSVEIDANGERQLVVVATKGAAVWKSVVTAAADAGSSIHAQPLNDESTVEAEVHARVIAHGTSNASFYTDIATDVDAAVAALVKGNAQEIDELASSIEAEAETHLFVLSDSSIAVTQAELQTIARGRAAALEELEGALDGAADSVAVAAAFADFHDAVLAAHLEGGVSAGATARAREAGARALVRSATALDADTRFAIARAAAHARARYIDAAVRARLTQLGATPSELSAAAASGATLAASVDAAESNDELNDAFDDYHVAIVSSLQASAETHSTAIGTLDAAIRGAGGAKLALESAVSAAIATTSIADAYIDFHQSVASLAAVTLLTASTAEITAIAEILTVINMSFSML